MVRHDADVVGELLRDETGDREHGEAAVLELLGLDLSELGAVGGLEAERVEADVARVVVVVEEVLALDLARRRPAGLGARGLDDADGDGEELEELGLTLRTSVRWSMAGPVI